MLEGCGVGEDNWRDALDKVPGFAISDSPTYVARGIAGLAASKEPGRWSGQIVTARQLADTYDVTDTDGSRPDCWGYISRYGIEEQSGEHIQDYRLQPTAAGQSASAAIDDRRTTPCHG